MWSSLQEMLPRSGRCITTQWFAVLSRLAYLRLTYKHFHHGFHPTWADKDPLLGERIESLASAARRLQDEDGDEGDLGALFNPFR